MVAFPVEETPLEGEAGSAGRDQLARLRAPVSDPRDLYLPLRAPFALEGGDLLPDPHVRLRRHGRRNGAPVLVMGGISSGRKLCGDEGWWNELVGDGLAIDLSVYCALGIDFSPVSDVRVSMSPHAQARLILWALDELGIARISVVGASYGGMVGLALAALAPERVRALCMISAAHRPFALASAWRGVARRIVEFGLASGRGLDGLALARQLSMITYRSGEEFGERFHGILGPDGLSDLDRYLIARGEAYRAAMSAERWLTLSEAIDRFSVSPAGVKAPVTLVACPTDQIAPFADMSELASRLPNLVALHALPSRFGHDAFLKESGRLGGILSSFLKTS